MYILEDIQTKISLSVKTAIIRISSLPLMEGREHQDVFKEVTIGGGGGDVNLGVSGDIYTQRLASPMNTGLTIDAGAGSHNTLTLHDDVNISGSVSCGAYIESNLQTEQQKQEGSINRFEEGDVLCWGIDQLELCSTANDRLVQAVADAQGRPIVLGAEVVKVLGPVQRGDILVAADVPGYAMVNDDPVSGSVIAQALEAFQGEQGVIKAMIRKW